MVIMTATTDTTRFLLDEECTEDYFKRRIETLRTIVLSGIPNEDSIDHGHVFRSIIESLDVAKESLAGATNLLSALEKKQKIDPNSIEPELIDQAKKSVQKAQDTVDHLHTTGKDSGSSIVQSSGLIQSLLTVEHHLLECTVLVQSTPKKLAAWCSENPKKHKSLLCAFLNNTKKMKAFLKAGGPVNGHYGPALTIYSQLQSEIRQARCDPKMKDIKRRQQPLDHSLSSSLVQRLALAVALQHASPIIIFQQTPDNVVDPVERFWQYANAYVDGDLDPAFDQLTSWELRFVVDSNATEDDLKWGREYLKTYRPDEIMTSDDRWRYVKAVRTDVGYREPDHDFANYKDLVSAGGKCGARAWFGRFVCKAWGIPTWGVRQPGHAALSHWTKGGWTICLGAGWEVSWWDETRYTGSDGEGRRNGLDFIEEAEARSAASQTGTDCVCYYQNVILLECLSEICGETIEEDFVSGKLWRSLSIAQRKVLAERKAVKIETVGASTTQTTGGAREEDRPSVTTIQEGDDGSIVISAASFVSPSKPTNNVMVMDSFFGGGETQLHLEHDGGVGYALPSTIVAGTYAMSLKVVNIHQNQHPIYVTIDDSSYCSVPSRADDDGYVVVPMPSPQKLNVQYTVGRWQYTESIRVDVCPGTKLTLRRDDPSCWGLTIKEILLQPISR